MTRDDDNRVTLDITGMTCAACSNRIESVLGRIGGVSSATVSLPLGRADIIAGPDVRPADLVKAVENAGYHADIRGEGAEERRVQRLARAAAAAQESRRTRNLAALAVVLALPFLIDMVGMLAGAEGHLLPPWVQFGLATVAQIVLGARFYRGAWAAVRNGFANMDVLVALGTSAAYGLSVFNLLSDRLHHGGGLYFEAGVIVLAFLYLGKALEGQAKSGASAALEALANGAPQNAVRIVDGVETNVEASSLKVGDHIAVRPGAQVPADGTIVSGRAAFDESLITGESVPVTRGTGDLVIAGSVASGGHVEVEVIAIGEDTRLARIGRMIEDADIAKSPIQQLADRISAVFVPIVMVIAFATGLIWWLVAGQGEHAVLSAVAVLVVACPCALGLATPITLVAGANAAARAGLIVTDHASLDVAGQVTRIAFDKTGTLTDGHPALVGSASGGAENEALILAAALATRSDHPVDRALVQAASDRGLALPAASGVSAIAGRGIAGQIAGRSLVLGNAAFMAEHGVTTEATGHAAAATELANAGSIVFLAEENVLLGAFGFADTVRASTAEALAELDQLGLKVTVLSGDRVEAVAAFSRQLGLGDARAALTPDLKIRAIRDLQATGDRVALVGDGINDAPGLRAADLGVAMASGTDAAKAAAGVTLARPDPRLVATLVQAGRATRATIAQNLGFAFIFNAIGIPLAAFGKLSPALAGAAMAASSVSVVLNAARLARKKF